MSDFPVLHVVVGMTGEYSDHNEWLSRAFRVEADARTFVEFLTAERQKLAAQGDHLAWDERDRVEAAMRVFDPDYSEDYTGTHWSIRTVDFDDGGPL